MVTIYRTVLSTFSVMTDISLLLLYVQVGNVRRFIRRTRVILLVPCCCRISHFIPACLRVLFPATRNVLATVLTIGEWSSSLNRRLHLFTLNNVMPENKKCTEFIMGTS